MQTKIFILIALLASCAPTVKNFEKYQKQFISKSDFMPDKDSYESKLPKVAIFDFEDGEIEVAKQANLSKSVAVNVENILSKYRLAEIVDRNAVNKLQKEVQLAEMNKTGAYKGPKVADYAVSGSISNASFNSKYVNGSTYIDKKGNLISVPPKYVYTSNVAGNIKLYELPSLGVAQAIEFSATAVRNENVQQDGGVSFGGLQIGGSQKEGENRDDGLIRKAGSDAIEEVESIIRNFFAKKGYIIEKRSYEDKSIFKVNLGSEDGLVHGDKFVVTGKYEVDNSITGETGIETRVIGAGRVSNLIDPKNCWIVIDEKKHENSIRIGDVVKMQYSKDRMKSLGKSLNVIVNSL